MGKLSHEQIADEVKQKGFELVDDANYSNMHSPVIIQCDKKHLISTSLFEFRKVSFCCPVCDKDINFINPKTVPEKADGVYRIVAFDQATENFGVSVFDNNKLVYYCLYKFSGNLVARLVKIRKFVQDVVIQSWKPDYLLCEDIQYQNNGILTFKILAMLLGIIQEVAAENDIEYEVVSPNVWRKFAGTAGKDRSQEKKLSVARVKEKYNIIVIDDIAEAILIGHYGVRTHRIEEPSSFGRFE